MGRGDKLAGVRAIVMNSFALPSRGTVLTLNILEGSVKAGDVVRIGTGEMATQVTVRSVEFVLTTSYREEPAIIVQGLEPSAVPAGTPVSS